MVYMAIFFDVQKWNGLQILLTNRYGGGVSYFCSLKRRVFCMKQNYEKPIIILEEIVLEDVILASGIIRDEGNIDINDGVNETL